MSLKILGIPQFSDQFPESRDQLKALISRRPGLEDVHVVVSFEEIVPNPLHVGEELEDNVHVVIGLDVVESNHAGDVLCPVKCTRLFGTRGQSEDEI